MSLVLLPVVVLVVFLSTYAAHREKPVQVPSTSTATLIPADSLAQPLRPAGTRAIFPYSIVPGGVRDERELQAAASADPVVAQHYSDFQISRARSLRMDHPVAMYVSYRRNNRVYWTRNRMIIPAGETLLSDGEHLARVRCGNRLSPVAAKPVAETEPSGEELDQPSWVPPLLADLMPAEGAFVPGGPAGDVNVPPGVPSGPSTPNSPGSAILPPILLPGSSPIPFNIGPPPPPVVTPEPGSLGLLLAGVSLIAVLTALTRRNGSA